MMHFDLALNGKTITRFEAKRTATDTIAVNGAPDREIGTYQWTCWRDGLAVSSGELNHYVDMGIEYLAYLILEDYWEDQVSRLCAEAKQEDRALRTRYEAEQEIARGR